MTFTSSEPAMVMCKALEHQLHKICTCLVEAAKIRYQHNTTQTITQLLNWDITDWTKPTTKPMSLKRSTPLYNLLKVTNDKQNVKKREKAITAPDKNRTKEKKKFSPVNYPLVKKFSFLFSFSVGRNIEDAERECKQIPRRKSKKDVCFFA